MVNFSYSHQGREPEREEDYSKRFEQRGYYPPQGTPPQYEYPYGHNNPKRIDREELDTLTLEDYGLTPQLVKGYMFGIQVKDPATGKEMGDDFFRHFIEMAVSSAEQELDIAIFPRLEVEHHDFQSQEANSYMHTHVHKRPIIQVEKFQMEFNGRPVYDYPSEWWKPYHLFGHIEVMPSPMVGSAYGNDMNLHALPYSGMYHTNPIAGRGKTFAPQMIHVDYIAGLLPRKHQAYNRPEEMPATLEQFIAKTAVKEIFQQWGRILVQPGLASSSLSIDGISQSMGTTQSAMYSAMSAEIAQIDNDLKDLKDRLKSYFGNNPLISV